MDTLDRPDANLPARLPGAPGPVPTRIYAGSRELAAAGPPSSAINTQLILRGLMRNWWRILLIWVTLALPTAYLLYILIPPTYDAVSTLRIEPTQPELFGTTTKGTDMRSFEPYLQTQRNLILSDTILNMAISDPTLQNFPIIQNPEVDPKTDIRQKLDVKILPNTYLIQVSFSSTDPNEAQGIVNAVVGSFLQQNQDLDQGAKRTLKGSYSEYVTKLDRTIKEKRDELLRVAKTGNVEFVATRSPEGKTDETDQGPLSAFSSLSLEQYKKTTEKLLQTEMELIDAEAQLQARQAAEAQGSTGTAAPEENDALLHKRIVAEFRADPEVIALIDRIKTTKEELDRTKGVARKGHDPARIAAEKRKKALEDEYYALWETRSEEIRQRLMSGGGDSNSTSTLAELQRKVEALKLARANLSTLIEKYKAMNQDSSENTVQATLLKEELASLMKMRADVQKKVEQLEFEENKGLVRVGLVDPATAPKAPTSNKRWKYMAILPVGMLFGLLGLFLLLEVKAERVADPDLLSSRVQSEVYALPPLPTSRAARRLKSPLVDEQIDRFIQRLDHLRFAVCGTPPEAGVGRCVLITSAVGGEGKTTLAAQLAARCGNAGISTLLVDADLRRGALNVLLDIPEGPGLSDVLKHEANLEEIITPVQGGTFHLLSAGTPVPDTSRIFQGRNLGMLIAQLRQLYEIVIVDSPPVLPVADALVLGRWCDGALLAARFEVSRSPQVERARRQLDSAGIPVLGTVINGMRSSDSYYGRYTYKRHRTSPADPTETT
jgi:succinoglycan biosynthesis transport protein ExoP